MFCGRSERAPDWWRGLGFQILLGASLIWFLALLAAFFVLRSHLKRDAIIRLDGELETALFHLTHWLERQPSPLGQEAIREEMRHLSRVYGQGQCFLALFDGQGHLLEQTDRLAWPAFEPHWSPREASSHPFQAKTRDLGSGHPGYRSATLHYSPHWVFQIGFSLAATREDLGHSTKILILSMSVAFGLSMVLSTLFLRRALAGLETIRTVSRDIQNLQDLAKRIPLPTGSRDTDQLAAQLNQMLSQMADMVSTQREMFNHIAHDIRSPVTRLRLLGEQVLSADFPQAEEWGGRLVEECDGLQRLLNQLLEIAQAESGLSPVQNEWVRLDELVREAADLFSIVAEEKGLQLQLAADLPPLLVRSDKRHLQRIFANLVDNALKFTPSGPIALGLVHREGELGLYVQDSGPGLSEEQQSRVFQKFFRADPARTRAGFGLGLAYCQAACSMLEARLHLESRPGEGCRFEVLFPAVKGAAAVP